MGNAGPSAAGHYAEGSGELNGPVAAPAVALTIAGSDCSGGAGLQADLKTFTVHGVYGASVVTALTAQNTHGVQAVQDVSTDFVLRQLQSVVGDLKVGAAKTGMLASADLIEALCASQHFRGLPFLVADPVMVATSGHSLLSGDAIAVLRSALLPLAGLLTPNLAEAALLTGDQIAGDEAAMERQGRRLLEMGAGAVLMKGGHADAVGGDSDTVREAVDLLVTPSGTTRFAAAWVPTRHTHGSGCTLSAAITAGLALGKPLDGAVRDAKSFVTRAIIAASKRPVGGGRAPLDHLAALRDEVG